MARRTRLMTLAFLVFVLAANLQPTHSSPINWDKVDLTKDQKRTVERVDGLLNELLKQLEEMFREKPKKNPTGGLHSTSEVDASIHSEEVPAHKDEEAVSDEHDDSHKIVFPQ